MAIAVEAPSDSGRPISHWTPRELAEEVVRRGIVAAISPRSVSRFLEQADLKPHLSRYWLTPDPHRDPEQFTQEVKTVCDLYQQAPALHEQGVHVVSTDEMTGIQALERRYPDLPMRPGLVQSREFEYIRHGTLSLIGNFDVATGRVTGAIGPTRTESDFAQHVARTVDTDPKAKWIFLADQLNTHMSESLVRWVAERLETEDELGVKGKSGILKSRATRKAFLSDPAHRIRFVYTPKHSSWLNQIEIWFSILVRKLLRRSSFASLEDLKSRLEQFIDYFNKTMAKPFKWTYKGRPLQA